jgi:hypothetical protein
MIFLTIAVVVLFAGFVGLCGLVAQFVWALVSGPEIEECCQRRNDCERAE